MKYEIHVICKINNNYWKYLLYTSYFIITHSIFRENQHFNSPPTTIQKLFCSYILVGNSTIITPISFANETLKTVRIWQMKLLLISCRRHWNRSLCIRIDKCTPESETSTEHLFEGIRIFLIDSDKWYLF